MVLLSGYWFQSHWGIISSSRPRKGSWRGGWQGSVPFPYATKCIAIKIERSKDFSRILDENLLTLMTQILREPARKMVSSLSFKTLKMKFQKKAVRHNDCQALLYQSQRVDHTHSVQPVGGWYWSLKGRCTERRAGGRRAPGGPSEASRRQRCGCSHVAWGKLWSMTWSFISDIPELGLSRAIWRDHTLGAEQNSGKSELSRQCEFSNLQMDPSSPVTRWPRLLCPSAETPAEPSQSSEGSCVEWGLSPDSQPWLHNAITWSDSTWMRAWFSVMSNSATLWTVRLLCPWHFPGKNTGVGCHFLLQGTLPTQGSNLHLLRLLHWHAGSLPAEPSGKPASTWRPYSKIKQIWISGIRTQTLAVFVCHRPADNFLTLGTDIGLPIF